MSEMIEGGCRCGAVRYRLKLPRFPNAYACHCLFCQTWSGSAFSLQIVADEDALEIEGEPYLYERVSDDGERISRQRGCSTCITRVYNTNSSRPGMVVLRAGTLDRSNELEVAAHIWVKRKVGGIDIPDGVPQWPEGAPPAAFAAALLK